MKKNDYKKPPFSLDRTRYGDLAAQLASSLRTAIETGYYRAGDILPPVRELAKLLGVSAGIAARALSIVRDEGLINPRPCVGSVVCAKGQPLWKGHVVIVVPPGPGNRSDNTVHSRLRDTLTAEGYLTTPVTVTSSSSSTTRTTSRAGSPGAARTSSASPWAPSARRTAGGLSAATTTRPWRPSSPAAAKWASGA